MTGPEVAELEVGEHVVILAPTFSPSRPRLITATATRRLKASVEIVDAEGRLSKWRKKDGREVGSNGQIWDEQRELARPEDPRVVAIRQERRLASARLKLTKAAERCTDAKALAEALAALEPSKPEANQ